MFRRDKDMHSNWNDHVDNISLLQERSVTIPCYSTLSSSGSRCGSGGGLEVSVALVSHATRRTTARMYEARLENVLLNNDEISTSDDNDTTKEVSHKTRQ